MKSKKINFDGLLIIIFLACFVSAAIYLYVHFHIKAQENNNLHQAYRNFKKGCNCNATYEEWLTEARNVSREEYIKKLNEWRQRDYELQSNK